MNNKKIAEKIDQEKSQEPYKIFSRFYKSLIFPGLGHTFLGLKPKNTLYPLIGCILLSCIFYFGSLSHKAQKSSVTLNKLATYNLYIGDKNRQNILSQREDVLLLMKIFTKEKLPEALTDSLKKIYKQLKQFDGQTKLAVAKVNEKFKIELETIEENENEADIIKTRDIRVAKAKKELVEKFERRIKDEAAAPIYSFVKGRAITNKSFASLHKNHLHQSKILDYKFYLLIALFVLFWIFTCYDLAIFFGFGKLFNMLKEIRTGFGFLSFNIVGFLVFIIGPVLYSLVLSFSNWDMLTERVWVGFENYRRLFADPLFWKYLGNTFFFFVNIPLGMAAALALAIALNQKIKGITFYRVVYYLPVVSSMVAVAVLWRWIYNPDFGLLNAFLRGVGIDNPPKWLAEAVWAKPAISIMEIWKGTGAGMLLYLAALQGIPGHLYEAAEIDGASKWKQFLYITLPLLGPTHFFNIIMGVISSFQRFDSVYVMTQGGPAGSTTTIVYYIYNNAFEWFKMGYASAIAWVLFAMVFTITIVQWRYIGNKLYTD